MRPEPPKARGLFCVWGEDCLMTDKAAEIKNLVEDWVFRLNSAVAELREIGVALELSVSGNVLAVKLVDVREPAKADVKSKPKGTA